MREATSAREKSKKKTAMPDDSMGAVGRARIREAAGRALARKSRAIANKLAESAAEGNVTSAKLLVALSEGAVFKARKEMSKDESLALRLTLEPEWQAEALDEMDESDAMTSSGDAMGNVAGIAEKKEIGL